MKSQRDTFISGLFELAKNDKDVYFITVDMGASALDRWREELPEQVIFAGISEQHAINYAAGMAAEGKKVYVYFMAAWVARCFEQIPCDTPVILAYKKGGKKRVTGEKQIHSSC